MKFNAASLSKRLKVVVVTATSLVPLVGIVIAVVIFIFIPIFRTLEDLTAQSLFEMIPLHELQSALHRSTMAARTAKGEEFVRSVREVELNYRQILESNGIRDQIRIPLASSLTRWRNQSNGFRPFVSQANSPGLDEAVEQYVAVIEHLSGEIDGLHRALHQDIVMKLGETEARKRQGFILLLAASAFSVVVGTAGSILISRDRKRLELRSLVDPLTGVSNRKGFEAAFRTVAGTTLGPSQRKFSLTIFDIDHFKSINDQHGHASGDAALKEVARVVRSCLREGDHLARLGGDEFAILVPNVAGRDAFEMADRIRRQVAETLLAGEDGAAIQLHLSIGVACCPDDGCSLVDLSNAADAALYQAKKAGRNKTVAATDSKPVRLADSIGRSLDPSISSKPNTK